jgi:hypothetical protein
LGSCGPVVEIRTKEDDDAAIDALLSEVNVSLSYVALKAFIAELKFDFGFVAADAGAEIATAGGARDGGNLLEASEFDPELLRAVSIRSLWKRDWTCDQEHRSCQENSSLHKRTSIDSLKRNWMSVRR